MQVIDYIEFLIIKYQNTIKEENVEIDKRPSHFGNAKGQVQMSDDFDEPL